MSSFFPKIVVAIVLFAFTLIAVTPAEARRTSITTTTEDKPVVSTD